MEYSGIYSGKTPWLKQQEAQRKADEAEALYRAMRKQAGLTLPHYRVDLIRFDQGREN